MVLLSDISKVIGAVIRYLKSCKKGATLQADKIDENLAGVATYNAKTAATTGPSLNIICHCN